VVRVLGLDLPQNKTFQMGDINMAEVGVFRERQTKMDVDKISKDNSRPAPVSNTRRHLLLIF
jgi:hypothetical protein